MELFASPFHTFFSKSVPSGVQVNASGNFFISRTAGRATFEEANPYYYSGEVYTGKVTLNYTFGKYHSSDTAISMTILEILG